ncbi:MAG TPA: hypothetical protein VKL99_17540 [Candidatus Angelobacter sp.]|nr:hypothetical protein [Candidatus Angelobacter sp.]
MSAIETQKRPVFNRIFDEIERTNTRYRRSTESSFDFYNVSARPKFVAIRELIEQWYAEFPDAGKADIRGRLRSRKETDFRSAFFEVYLYRLCRALGFSVDIYPGMEHHARKSHPDFILSRDGEPVLYLEGTLAQKPQSVTAAERRQAELEDAINQLPCPNFWLFLDTSGTATENITISKVRQKLRGWLEGLNAEQVIKNAEIRGDAALPTFVDSYGGLAITITAHPKSPESRGDSDIPTLGAVMPDELLEWDTKDDIRQAVVRKAKCYGDLKLPYIIAINVMNELFEFDDILDGLFGQRSVELRLGSRGVSQRRIVNAGDGALRGKKEPRNTIVSGVLIANNLIPTTIGIETPLLVHHPWAQRPFPTHAWKLPQKSIDAVTGKIISHPGLQAREILGIPERWPMPDDDD